MLLHNLAVATMADDKLRNLQIVNTKHCDFSVIYYSHYVRLVGEEEYSTCVISSTTSRVIYYYQTGLALPAQLIILDSFCQESLY